MRKLIVRCIAVLLALTMVASAFAAESKGSASTLRLEKTEGTVNISKASGSPVSIRKGMRLYDGYNIKTGPASKAYISLDGSKAIMLDSSTSVSIRKSGKKLEIMLHSGTVLVNVKDKMGEDGELNIRTMNSVTGVRGTIAQITYINRTGNTEIYLFEGETEGIYLAPDGSWYSLTLREGLWTASGTGAPVPGSNIRGWVFEDGMWYYKEADSEDKPQTAWIPGVGWVDLGRSSTDESAWPFRFGDLAPAVREEIINDPGMLERGRRYPELYPELLEENVEESLEKATEERLKDEEEARELAEAIEKRRPKPRRNNLFDEDRFAAGPVKYRVRFMPGYAGAPALIAVQMYEPGEAIAYPADPARNYYTFNAWDLPAPQNMPANNLDITAQWTPITYTLTFDPSGGGGAMGNQTFTAEDVGNINANTFLPPDANKAFTGWSDSAFGAVVYKDQAPLPSINKDAIAAPAYTLGLFAHWSNVKRLGFTFAGIAGPNYVNSTEADNVVIVSPNPVYDFSVLVAYDDTVDPNNITFNFIYPAVQPANVNVTLNGAAYANVYDAATGELSIVVPVATISGAVVPLEFTFNAN
ncbi:MAG TPA: FecR family protein [Bacillota bacterium]|nr:FecR family protein [Bacillota bacterium]